jgi:4-hydroxy-3-polyprenylbenzoate decarboxylase
MTRRVVIGITGATGAPFGVRLLAALRELPDVETHLVVSEWARATVEWETGRTARQVLALADHHYAPTDQGARISSGSFRTHGMIVAPCSMRTLAGIRSGFAHNLIGRAADVTLKERRPLVLVPRETPLSEIHLDNMLALARMGVRIVPPMPAFYHRPTGIDDILDHTTARILDQLDIDMPAARRWDGFRAARNR